MGSDNVPEWHQLHYKGKELPDFLFKEGVKVTNDIGTFRYSEREDQYSSGGFVYIVDRKIEDAKIADIFTLGEEFKQGYYSAAFDEKHPFTPEHWTYVEADGPKEDLYWVDKRIHYWINIDICCKRPDKENEVVKVANQYAVKEGYKLDGYNEPEVKFDFLTQEWILFYYGKGVLDPDSGERMYAPGDHFGIYVDNETMKVKHLMPGK
jgi:hypothetical protein